VVELRDRDVIAGALRRRAAVHAYELGDLDDFFWPRTRWFGWRPGQEIEQVALVYDEPDPPVLLALADERERGMAELLRAIAWELPERVYAHLSPGLVDALAPRLVPEGNAALHRKLALVDHGRLAPYDSRDAVALSPADRDEVEGFYRAAYPGTWFQLRMLETGRYVGIRRDGVLVCVAGVHVWSPTWGVATLGNVATVPALRGSGLATAACARLCRVLLEDGIDVISLNVRADNLAAIRTYEKLGFAHAADYVEVLLGPGREPSTGTDVETRLGSYAVLIDERERILLALWNEGPTPAWTLPGGGAEPGETSEQAAIREVLEETGYHVELGRFLGEDSFSVAAEERLDGSVRSLRAVRHVFEARIVGGELRAEVGGTTDRAEWIPIDRVPELERVGLVDVALRLAQRWPK
jgi:ADP-ribose pyrophosphatase YjhB (NUDIX family)/RimJ/RimL family protein N-acetyltransferase